MNAQEIRDLFQKHKISLSRDDVWEVQGNPVVKHQALERLSSALRIIWQKPEVLRAERDEAVLIVTGNLPSGPSEWSIGEAVIGQNLLARNKTAIYPYAMAEKRAKDRVILKLAGLYGSHSDEEADDFKQGAPPPVSIADPEGKWKGEYVEAPQPEVSPSFVKGLSSKDIYIMKAIDRMNDMDSASDLLAWAKTEREKVWPQYGIQAHDEDGQAFVHAYMQRKAALEGNEEAA